MIFFLVDGVRVVEEFVKQFVEKWRHAVVEVLGVERILLHFVELVALENKTQKSVASLFQALQVVLEHLVFSLDHLDFSER